MDDHLRPNSLKRWIENTTIFIVWLLFVFVALFTVANMLTYILVPVDGASIWVKDGPITVQGVASNTPGGLQEGDVVLSVQDQNLDWWLAQRWRTLPGILQRIGQENPTTAISVLRDSRAQDLTVPLSPRPGGAVGWLFFTYMVIGLAFLGAGWVILQWGGRSIAVHLAVIVMLLMALIEQNEILTTLGAEYGWSMLWAFIPLRLFTRWFAYSFALVFALSFPHPKPWLRRRPYIALLILLLNPIVTTVIMLNVDGNLHYRHTVAYPWSKNIYIVYLALTCIILFRTYFTTQDIISKNQLRWIAWGGVMATLPNILLVDIAYLVWGVRLLPEAFASLLLIFIPVTFMVAILRYRLWNIDLIIKASLVYGALTLALGVVYLGLVSIFIGLLGWSGSEEGQTSNNAGVFFLSALVVAFLFTPLRDYVQRFIDRLFFRNQLNYSDLLSEMSRTLATTLLLDDLLEALTQTIPDKLNLRGGMVVLDALPPPDHPDYQRLTRGRLVWFNDRDGKKREYPPPIDQFQKADMWCCVPLLSGGELLGFYGLGRKKSDDYYNREDTHLVETLARQAGLALENARLHEEISVRVQLQRDMEIARNIQLSLLPAQDPVIPGLEIVGFSIPAEEVGGDFYHYLEFDDGRVDIAVGDVSGKGVSAALFMAVAVSTLHAKSPYHEFTPQLLAEMNDLLHGQMQGNINTALLYTSIRQQPDGRFTLSASNAGLISPVLRRQGEEMCQYIEVGGLPLGVMKDVNYHAYHMHLLPGDLILLLSDGVVEAMNPHAEIFGFDRLEHFLLQYDGISAETVVQQLRREITQFVGQAKQHDDITMVAVRVK